MWFQVLGTVEGRIGDAPVRLNRRRERCLLGLMLLEPGRTIGVDRLIDLLWDEPPQQAKRTLHSHVARVRAALAGAGMTDDILSTGPRGYALNVAPETVDAHRFRRLVEQARLIPAPTARAAQLHDALALWNGPVLGEDGMSGLSRRVGVELEAMRSAALESWLAALVESGQNSEAFPHLASAVADNPERERLTELLMTVLYRLGRKAEALSAFDHTRAWLAEKLGVDPTPALRRVHELVLRDEVADATPVPAGEGTGREVPAAAWRVLPHDVAAFVGRQEDLAWLDHRARSERSTLAITVVAGAPGIGKTALALHWAHRSASQYPDGQLYVNLRGYDVNPPLSPLDALAYLLRCLGCPPDQLPTDVHEAAARYRSMLADRQVLVILDNARTADQVRPLLPGGARCHALITSRDRLSGLIASDGARRLTLGHLPEADGLTLLTQLLGEERVSREPQAAVQVVALCAGLPLALRIAAAKLSDHDGLSLADYAADLAEGSRLEAFTVIGDENRAVKAVLDHSFVALSAPVQRTLRLLGLTPGPDFTVAQAAVLAGASPGEAASALDTLAAAHLIQQAELHRFSFHDLVREYAHTKTTDEDSAALARLLEYLKDMTVHADSFIIGTGKAPRLDLYPALDTAPAAMAWLDAERANLIAAVSAATACGLTDLACDVARALAHLFHFKGYTGEWITTFETALAAVEHLGETTTKYFLLNSLGNAHYRAGHVVRATEALEAAIEGREALGDVVAAASSQHNLANIYGTLGQYDEALKLLQAALSTARQTGDLPLQRLTLSAGISGVYQKLGMWTEALDCLLEAMDLVRDDGSTFELILVLANLGRVYLEIGDLARAEEHFSQGLELARGVGDRYYEPLLLAGLADICREHGRYDEGIALRSEADAKIQGDLVIYETESLNGLGSLYAAAGRRDQAYQSYQQARALASERGERHELGRALAGLGTLLNSPQYLHDAVTLLDPIAPVDAERVREAISRLPR